MATCYICHTKPVSLEGMPCRPCSIQRNLDIKAGRPVCDDPYTVKTCVVDGTPMAWDATREKRSDWIKKVVCSEECRIIYLNRPEVRIRRRQGQRKQWLKTGEKPFTDQHIRGISKAKRESIASRNQMTVFQNIQRLLGGRTVDPEVVKRRTETLRRNMDAREAAGLPRHHPISPETREKMSAAKRGRPSPHQDKINESNRLRIEREKAAGITRPRSPETRAKISALAKARYASGEQQPSRGMAGKTMSEEARRKMSKSRTGRKRGPMTEEHKRKLSEKRKALFAAGLLVGRGRKP